jgi:glyoxylase-like metal-dependent hydrolase (beta-lactamase superfamily II)
MTSAGDKMWLMTYAGDVTSGGPSDQRNLPLLTIRKTSVGAMANNVYLLTCPRTGKQLLIDAAADPERITALLAEGSGGLETIVTTHQHWDHHRALAHVAASTKAMTAAGDADAAALPVIPSRRLVHGDRITFGDVTLDVIHLRGHTPGSVALAYHDPHGHTHIWTGDSLFPGGPGRTTREEDFTSLMNDLEERVFDIYDDDTWIYPGHGPDTTLGAERPHLKEWRKRGW